MKSLKFSKLKESSINNTIPPPRLIGQDQQLDGFYRCRASLWRASITAGPLEASSLCDPSSWPADLFNCKIKFNNHKLTDRIDEEAE